MKHSFTEVLKQSRDAPVQDPAPRRGKILKVKMGYNPNSSGIGTTVTVFLWGFAAMSSLASVVGGLILARISKKLTGGESEPVEVIGEAAPDKPEAQ